MYRLAPSECSLVTRSRVTNHTQ